MEVIFQDVGTLTYDKLILGSGGMLHTTSQS